MKKVDAYIGFDCGNSSVRTVLGTFDGSRITTKVIHQVPNQGLRGVSYDYWDILAIFHEMQKGMKLGFDAVGTLSSFGVSTWGIDFGFLGQSGELLANPLCYRNPLGSVGMASRSQSELDFLFDASGIQNLPMNSMYQLLGIREKLPEYYAMAKSVLLIPDLLNYLFTGESNSELSIASTTQLLDMRSRDYSKAIFAATGLPKAWFPPLVGHAEVRGRLKEEITSRLGVPRLPAISVPSHDTASAVVSVPTDSKDFVFISSGTWSLIGTELDEPIINTTVRDHGFSNEGGAFGSITFLKNSCGMHILQNIKRELEFSDNQPYTWDEIVKVSLPALKDKTFVTFDPNAGTLYNPVSMIEALKRLTGLDNLGRIIASAYHSLAVSYTEAISQLEHITGKIYPEIHIIGGGSRNAHLNQMTADLSGKTVVAGPDEATSLGTIAVQVMHDHPELSLRDVRAIIRNSVELSRFTPAGKQR
jgi:rhamnulokinase